MPIVVVSKGASYPAAATDNVILVTAAATITLPAVTGLTGKQIIVKNLATTGVLVVVDTTGGATIDGQLSWTMAVQYLSMTMVTDGINWYII